MRRADKKTLLRCSISFCLAYQKKGFRSRWFSKQGPRGAQRRFLRRVIRDDFPFGLIFVNRGLGGTQRSLGIQDEAQAQSNLPLEMSFFFFTVAERRAAQIHCVGPFEMTLHSEWISQNWDWEARADKIRYSVCLFRSASPSRKQIRGTNTCFLYFLYF